MTKGDKYRLTLEGSTHFILISILSEKIGLSGFTQQNFLSIFSPLVSVDLKIFVMCETLCYLACNNFEPLLCLLMSLCSIMSYICLNMLLMNA
jgi:hypothetical protein